MFILCDGTDFSNVIDFVSIVTAGNATDFGDIYELVRQKKWYWRYGRH